MAQSDGAERAPEPPTPRPVTVWAGAESAILVVSMDQIRSRSLAAQSIERQAADFRQRLREELDSRREALRAEEKALVSLRDTLDREAFEFRAAEFERQVRQLKEERRRRANQLQAALRRATDALDTALRPILAQIMAERGAAVLIDNRNVVLSATALDVTQVAIKRLDASMPSLEVQFSPIEQP